MDNVARSQYCCEFISARFLLEYYSYLMVFLCTFRVITLCVHRVIFLTMDKSHKNKMAVMMIDMPHISTTAWNLSKWSAKNRNIHFCHCNTEDIQQLFSRHPPGKTSQIPALSHSPSFSCLLSISVFAQIENPWQEFHFWWMLKCPWESSLQLSADRMSSTSRFVNRCVLVGVISYVL